MNPLKKLDMKKYEAQAAKALLGIAIFMAAVVLFKMTTVIVHGATARSKVTAAFEATKKTAGALEEYKKRMQTVVDKAVEKNPFAPEAPKPMPPQFAGIMGEEVLYNGQWYKVGQEVGGAKITKIDPAYVMVDFQGKQTVVVPESKADPNAGRMGGGPGMARSFGGGDSGQSRGGGGPGGFGGGRGGFGRMMNMSPQEAENMRQRFMSMTPEERMSAMRQMRDNMRGQGN